MKRSISLALCMSLIALFIPTHAQADFETHRWGTETSTAPVQDHEPASVTGELMYSGTQITSNGWIQTYEVYADVTMGAVWGEGYTEDPTSLDADGQTTRWLSYSHYNGQFKFVGSDDGTPIRLAIGPSDLTWSHDAQGDWIADFTAQGPQPQALIGLAVLLAVAAAVILSGDSGCSCGHNGGTPNHPGTNHP